MVSLVFDEDADGLDVTPLDGHEKRVLVVLVAGHIGVSPVPQQHLHRLVHLVVHGYGQQGVALLGVDQAKFLIDPVALGQVGTVKLHLK